MHIPCWTANAPLLYWDSYQDVQETFIKTEVTGAFNWRVRTAVFFWDLLHVTQGTRGRVAKPPRVILGTRRKWAVNFKDQPLYPRIHKPGTQRIREWESHRIVWTLTKAEKSLSSAKNRTTYPRSYNSQFSHYTNCAMPAVSTVCTSLPCTQTC